MAFFWEKNVIFGCVVIYTLQRLWPLQSCRNEVTTWERMIVVLVMPTHGPVARKATSVRSCAHHEEKLYDDEMTGGGDDDDDHDDHIIRSG